MAQPEQSAKGTPEAPQPLARTAEGIRVFRPAPDFVRERGRLEEQIVRAGLALGLARVGIASAAPMRDAEERHQAWLAKGFGAEMDYLRGHRSDPRSVLPSARSVVTGVLSHAAQLLEPKRLARGPEGFIARYARGDDYHGVLKSKLAKLAAHLANLAGRAIEARVCVDTAPLLERELARRAGVGFVAKSTMLISPGVGSYVLLGEIVTDLELEPNQPVASGCGSCRQCLDACPTGAFTAEYELDARRCISYLTIEHRGAIDRELRPLLGHRVFGCDVCQEVCPFNASTKPRPTVPELEPRSELDVVDLIALLELRASSYRRLTRNSALSRVSRNRLARNAAIALGNSGDERAVEPLLRALAEHRSALVRSHVAWALGRLARHRPSAIVLALRTALDDPDPAVQREAALALETGGESLDPAPRRA